MTRVPKRRLICPKTVSCTFSWESSRAPFTKSPCSLVCNSVCMCPYVWVSDDVEHDLWLYKQKNQIFYPNASVLLYLLLPGMYCAASRCTSPHPSAADLSLVVCHGTVWSADVTGEHNKCLSPQSHCTSCSSFLTVSIRYMWRYE